MVDAGRVSQFLDSKSPQQIDQVGGCKDHSSDFCCMCAVAVCIDGCWSDVRRACIFCRCSGFLHGMGLSVWCTFLKVLPLRHQTATRIRLRCSAAALDVSRGWGSGMSAGPSCVRTVLVFLGNCVCRGFGCLYCPSVSGARNIRATQFLGKSALSICLVVLCPHRRQVIAISFSRPPFDGTCAGLGSLCAPSVCVPRHPWPACPSV